jgi:hypothetical protein
LLITGATGAEKIANLYENSGSNFTLNTAITLEKCVTGQSLFGDYDNDGDLDILLTGRDNSSTNISKLYQNTGGNFSEYTNANLTPVSSGTADFADYDNDGDLDIFLTGVTNITKVYQNTLSPMALPLSSGYRLISSRGNIQTLTATVKDLPDGTYY